MALVLREKFFVDFNMFNLSKAQVDKLGDRLRQDPIDEADLKLLDEYRKSFGEAYTEVVDAISEHLKTVEIAGRPEKSTSALIEKLRRESARLSQIQDIAGCRIVVHNIEEQDKTIKALRLLFPSITVVDRRIKPSFGYRAVHVIVAMFGKLVEVQVRTLLQHNWALFSEKLADEVDPLIKYGGGDDQAIKLLVDISQIIDELETIEEFGRLERNSDKAQKFYEKMEIMRQRLNNSIQEYINREFKP